MLSNLVISTCKKVLKDVRVCNDGMFAHAVDPALQLPEPLAHEIIFKPTYTQEQSYSVCFCHSWHSGSRGHGSTPSWSVFM